MKPPGHNTPAEVQPPGAPQPRRRATPWWGWLLSGCAVLALLGLVGSLAVFVWFNKTLGGVRQVTAEQQQGLLGDVPLYPNSTYNAADSQRAGMALRLVEKSMNKEPGSVIKTVALSFTQDPPEKVYQFYSPKLAENGWTELQNRDVSTRVRRLYRKEDELLMLQIERRKGETQISLMLGGPDLINATPSAGG